MHNILIISSYRDFCGPAAHTNYLCEALKNQSKNIIPNIFKLDVELLRNNNKFSYKAAKLLLNDIIHKSKSADKVIFQFEPGLLSSMPHLAYKRANYLLNKIDKKKIILIIHGFDRPSVVYQSYYNNFKTWFFSLRGLANVRLRYSWNYFNFLRNLKKINVICFNKNDVKELAICGVETSYYPITYLTKNKIVNLKDKYVSLREKWIRKLNYNKNDKIIVLFGFISAYKNFTVVCEALKYVKDKNWKIVIAGGLHPFSNDDNGELFKLLSYSSDRLIDKLKFFENIDFNTKNKIENFKSLKIDFEFISKLPQFVKVPMTFLGTISDDDINEIVSISDCCILPYLNTLTGQSGSGPFCISTELSNVTLISAAKVFMGQHNIKKSNDFIFDANNHLELAAKINDLDKIKNSYIDWRADFRVHYNIENFILKYFKIK